MKISVFHSNAQSFRGLTPEAARQALADGGYTHVADVKVVDWIESAQRLEDAFMLTNHVFRPWAENPCVTVKKLTAARSTSVGDLMAMNGVVYQVMPTGFIEVPGAVVPE